MTLTPSASPRLPPYPSGRGATLPGLRVGELFLCDLARGSFRPVNP